MISHSPLTTPVLSTIGAADIGSSSLAQDLLAKLELAIADLCAQIETPIKLCVNGDPTYAENLLALLAETPNPTVDGFQNSPFSWTLRFLRTCRLLGYLCPPLLQKQSPPPKQGDERSVLEVQFDVTVMPVFKQLMSGMISKGIVKRTDGLISELKYFAENDQPKASA